MSQNKQPAVGLPARGASDTGREASAQRADVMRLTAYVDELTNRLAKTQSNLDATETQLTRASHVLCQERKASDQTIATYRRDLAASHETESKLRAELSQNKSRGSLKDNTFLDSVGSALANDEQVRQKKRSLAELETKVGALGEFKVRLETETAQLTKLRDNATAELQRTQTVRDDSESAVAAIGEQLRSTKTELEESKKQLSGVSERLAAAKLDGATLSESLQQLRIQTTTAESECSQSEQACQAIRLEHAEQSRQLAEIKARVAGLISKEEAAKAALEKTKALSEKADELQNVPPFVLNDGTNNSSRRSVVTGACAPSRPLCTGILPPRVAVLASASKQASALPALVSIDSPVELTMAHVDCCEAATGGAPSKAGSNPTSSTMVTAITTDLTRELTLIAGKRADALMVAPP